MIPAFDRSHELTESLCVWPNMFTIRPELDVALEHSITASSSTIVNVKSRSADDLHFCHPHERLRWDHYSFYLS